MSPSWAYLALPLLVFGVATFLATWWLRGRGFREFRRRPPRDDDRP